MHKTPETNLIIEVDNVSRSDCDIAQRQATLLTLLDAAGKSAFCYALASLMDAESRVRQLKKQKSR